MYMSFSTGIRLQENIKQAVAFAAEASSTVMARRQRTL